MTPVIISFLVVSLLFVYIWSRDIRRRRLLALQMRVLGAFDSEEDLHLAHRFAHHETPKLYDVFLQRPIQHPGSVARWQDLTVSTVAI